VILLEGEETYSDIEFSIIKMPKSTGIDSSDDENSKKDKWSGVSTEMTSWEKRTARWCRKKWGTQVGNMIWTDTLPDVDTLQYADFNQHVTDVWDSINDSNSTQAKELWVMTSGFWSKEWQKKWRVKQYDKLFDKIEGSVTGSAALEVANLGMEKAHKLRHHLMRQFGGAGEDLQARQEHFEAGMPKSPGMAAFPEGIDIPDKLRQLEAERYELWNLCPAKQRDEYEYGMESTLVKIVLRHLRHTSFQETVKSLLQEIKMKQDMLAAIPKWDPATSTFKIPDDADSKRNTDDWDYRNFHIDWLPSWEALKSKLVSVHKERSFVPAGTRKSGGAQKLPTMFIPVGGGKPVMGTEVPSTPAMFMPGAGTTPRQPRCFGCGEVGHRKGDPGCQAGPDDWHECTPPKFLEKVKKNKRKGVDNMSSQRKSDGICYQWRDTGKCSKGPACRFQHTSPSGGSGGGGQRNLKRVKLTKTEKKRVTSAAIQSVTAKLKKRAKKDRKSVDDSDLRSYINSILFIRTIPRTQTGRMEVNVSAMATELLDTENGMCQDSGSGAFISTDKRDFVYLDESAAAKDSVAIRGPSVGAPGCGGIGALVYRCKVDGVPYGILNPDGIKAEGDVHFRVSSERICKARGLRVVNGEFNGPDHLQCVRTDKKVEMKTIDNILIMETSGKADEIIDSPEFRCVVDEVRNEERSPLVDLTPFLPEGRQDESRSQSQKWSKMSPGSFLTKFLFLTTLALSFGTTSLVFNEVKATKLERARLWCRRFGYCDTAIFALMASMPEYGDFPHLPYLNEDDLVKDQAKFSRKSFPRNDSSTTMDCPPWWRVYIDGYGGQNSLGGESYEGAVGSYLFVCCSTGSADLRLYASHEQFPVALHQFLRRVQAEHFKVHCIYCDTFSVNISEDVEEVCALFECVILPVSAGTPQEMAFAESMVRVIKRMSTAMLAGAPHLPVDSWATADKYAVYVHDFLPSKTRGGHCPFVLRTGKVINWKLLSIHTFGAPLQYAPIDGPIHKRAPVTLPGYFHGIQWPAVVVRRKEDMKLINVARQKIRVHEQAYCSKLNQVVDAEGEIQMNSYMGDVSDGVCDDSYGAKAIIEDGHTAHDVLESSSTSTDLRPELDKNMVQSLKGLREHRFRLPGQRQAEEKVIERSAGMADDDQIGGEGLYTDSICNYKQFDQLTISLQDALAAADTGITKDSVRDQVISKLKSAIQLSKGNVVAKGQLKVGKKKKGGMVSYDNVLTYKRKLHAPLESAAIGSGSESSTSVSGNGKLKSKSKPSKKIKSKQKKAHQKIAVGDLVSLPSSAFDGNDPGSFSDEHPERCMGKLLQIGNNGLCSVQWLEDQQVTEARLKDLTLEVRKQSVANIIVMLVEGEQVAFKAKDKGVFPKNFFELLVKSDWRKWVEAVKKELEGWDNNNAVTVTDIADVPKNAKVVPLVELYSVKRDGRYKFCQHLMGNLLRPGVDFGETFSATVSGSGVCSFYSIATTCDKWVWGWDAVCGYLQAKEQYDVYAFLPSHHDYSSLEYEELEVLRKEFLHMLSTEGEAGLKKFAAKHRRESRQNPKQVYKCNSSIYGCPGAGSAFEMLIHSVHTKTCGCTQTEVEPSIYVRILVDGEDRVTGYLIAAAFVDDLRFFGTEPEVKKYMEDVKSKLKVTFSEPPVLEFISIETYQCLTTHTTELKMPTYFKKAAAGFASFFPKGMKARTVPMSVLDEKTIEETPTEKEIGEAKGLPFRELLGVLSYPASQCKFEMKYAISMLGSRRSGWNAKQFEVVLKVLEYGLTTCEIGVVYSKGLDPHGDNTLYAYADASLRVPRSWGCQVVMMNGACVLYKARKQSKTAPSSCHSEIMSWVDCTTYILGLRNLMAELGMFQERPSNIYEDNESAQKIVTNRGSLGQTSRAMDLDILTARNRVEDQLVQAVRMGTKLMVADIGTKALPEEPFVRLRDVMNGYSLVKAAYPGKEMSPFVYNSSDKDVTPCVADVQAMIMRFTFSSAGTDDDVGSSSD